MAIISILAVAAGLIAAIYQLVRALQGSPPRQHAWWENIAFALALLCLGLAVVIIRNAPSFGPIVLVLGIAQLLFSAAAIAAFLTRLRRMVDGLCAVALGIFSFLTGFSIGVFVAPFALLLGIGALVHPHAERSVAKVG